MIMLRKCCKMASRMNKYYDEETQLPSRQAKNMELYREINMTEIEDFNLNSNISILDDNSDQKNIDIQKVREILKKRYEQEPKSKKIADYEEEAYTGLNLDETRDYDINAILEKAKENKEVNYEVDRLKKIRNTQFDILNSLDIETNEGNEEKQTDPVSNEQANLMKLIDTITSKELKKEMDEDEEDDDDEVNPLDILTDLKGTENTIVVPGVKEMVKNDEEKTGNIEIEEDTVEDKVEVKEKSDSKAIEKAEKPEEKEKVEKDDSFVSKSLIFTQSDFEDFEDLKDDNKAGGIVIKILTVIVILVLLFGIIFMLNGIFGWGLFWQ